MVSLTDFIVLVFVTIVNGQQDTIINTKYGPVEGHVVTLGSGQQVLSFLGVPFARPPIDELRFRVSTITK